MEMIYYPPESILKFLLQLMSSFSTWLCLRQNTGKTVCVLMKFELFVCCYFKLKNISGVGESQDESPDCLVLSKVD